MKELKWKWFKNGGELTDYVNDIGFQTEHIQAIVSDRYGLNLFIWVQS